MFKLQEQRVHGFVNTNKIRFEPDGDLVNQDPNRKIENDETSGAEYPNENDSEDTETNKTFAIPNFMAEILPDDEKGGS